MSKKALIAAAWLYALAPAVFGSPKNVAIVDREATTPVTEGEYWCQFLTDHGHTCTVFPKTGPTAALDSFDVVIDMSAVWSDSGGTLADFLRSGKTVITYHDAPLALGMTSNPTVQAWIGATEYINGANLLYSVARDPILGDMPPGTWLGDCSAALCGALRGTLPSAKVLAAYTDFDDPEPAGILRNVWEGGVSVFLTKYIDNSLLAEIMLNAVEARELTVPALGQVGLAFLALFLILLGMVILSRRRARTCRVAVPPHVALMPILVFAGSYPPLDWKRHNSMSPRAQRVPHSVWTRRRLSTRHNDRSPMSG